MTTDAPAPVGPDDYGTAARVGGQVLAVYVATAVGIAALLAGIAGAGDAVAWGKLGIMLAALGLHGSVFTQSQVSDSFGFGGSPSIAFGAVPFLLLGLALFLAYRQSSREEPSASARNAVIRGVLSAVVVIAPLAAFALMSHLRGDALGSGDAGDTIGAKVSSLIGWGLPILAIAFSAGRLAAYRSVSGLPPMRRVLADKSHGIYPWAVAALQTAVLSGGLIIVTGILYGLLSSRHEVADASSGADGSEAATVIAAVLLIPNIVFASTAFFMGFSVNIGIVSTFTGGPVGLLHGEVSPKTYLWVLAPLFATALLGVRQALRSPVSFADGWWRAGLGSLALWAPVAFFLRLEASGVGVGFTPLSVLLLSFAWGVLMLVLGQRLMGFVLNASPKLAGSLAGPAPVEGYGPALSSPLNPGTRKRLIAGGTALALIVAAVIAFKVVDTKVYGPEKAVNDYYTALAEGRVSDAVALLKEKPADSALLVDAALPSGRRITDVKVGTIRVHGATAFVDVSYQLQGTRENDSVALVQDGRTAGVFHTWKVSTPPGKLRVTGLDEIEGALVNGIDIGSATELLALPGLYGATFPAGSPLTASDDELAKMQSYGGFLSVSAELSPEAQAKASASALAYLRTCLAKATTLTTSCGITSYQYADSFKSVQWKLTREPDVSVRYDDSTGTAQVSCSGGQATVTGIAHTNSFFGQPGQDVPFSENESIYLSGAVAFSGSEAVFTRSS